MTKTLPVHPNIDWLKKTAKERLVALRASDPSAKLHQAQLEVAREYGFGSWRALKAHVDATSLDGEVVAAAVRGDDRQLARLLSEHPRKLDVTGGQWNMPLLHLAAENGHLNCIDLLLARGFDLNRRDRLDHATALHWAAQGGHIDVVKRLVAAGADINGEGDAHEINVIGWATCFHHVRGDVARYLLAQGARPTIFSAVALGRADLVRQLVEADRSLLSRRMSRFEHRRTPLHFAVLRNSPDMVALLLDLGAETSARDDRGNTPLNYASHKSDPRINRLLVGAGADPRELSANRFESVVPILNVKNVPNSIGYYVEKLGFEKEWDWGSPAVFACVHRDGVRIFLCEGAQGAPGTWMSVFVHDVDALHEDYLRRGALIRQSPTNFPWGLREMNVEDLDGHRLRMGRQATGAVERTSLDDAS